MMPGIPEACVVCGCNRWQPIETAPDRKYVLTFAIVDTETGNWRIKISSREERNSSGWEGWDYGYAPTHWMPLPPGPPADIAGIANGGH